MIPSPFHRRRARAFTLVELLVVLAIMILLVAASALGLQSVSGAGKFNTAVSTISGMLEQARSYAVAQNTYVWVVLYENTPTGNGPLNVYAAAFAANDGTDPFDWNAGAQVTIPTPGTYGTTTLTPIIRLNRFRGLRLQTTTMPQAPTGAANPATAPVFQCTGQSDNGPVTLSGTSTVYWVIQFTPTGAARNGSNPIDSIWFGLQPSHTSAPLPAEQQNSASVKVNGLTGLTTIYRE